MGLPENRLFPNWIWKRDDLTTIDKLVWLRLNMLQGLDPYSYPTLKQVGVAVGAHHKTVANSTDALENKGLLIVERRSKMGRANTYTVVPEEMDEVESKTPPSDGVESTTPGVASRTPPVESTAPGGGVPVDPTRKSFRNHSEGRREDTSSKSPNREKAKSKSKGKSTPIDPICVIPGHSHNGWCQFVKVDKNDDCLVCGAFQGMSTCYPDNHEGEKPELVVEAVGNWDNVDWQNWDPEV